MPCRAIRPLGLALVASLASLLATAVACGSADGESEFGDGKHDASTNTGGSSGNTGFGDDAGTGSDDSSAPTTQPGVLEAIVRDFKKWDGDETKTNPDFENTSSLPGESAEATAKWFPGAQFQFDIVDTTLGSDGKPVYNTSSMWEGKNQTHTTHGPAAFNEWYHDTPGKNVVRKVPIVLTKLDSGTYSYDSEKDGVPLDPANPSSKKMFFPIDDGTTYATTADGFGNQGNPHNYHFTVELHTRFTYRGNEKFKFTGDDDVFVFINNQLVINIGGIHSRLEKEISLPDIASEIGIQVGTEYALDFFQAERHVTESNLRIDTTLELAPAVVH